ncbi:hypothetical protein VSU19_14155 [Verrucomicrobiales bacterium BCK34]|nr:hypothetical protein [Verrucomicrobiales bacterium BCK34]
MIRKLSILATACLLAVSGNAAELPFADSFTSETQEARRLTRGPWIVTDGAATCTQDDALYKKFKDHGPVIWYDLDFTDATVTYSMKADEAVNNFVFTINGADGHVFRFVSSPTRTFVKAFPREGEPDGILDRKAPPLKIDQWIDVSVTFKGESAVVKIGEYEKTVTHPAIAQKKTTIGLGFSFGTMSFKDVTLK